MKIKKTLIFIFALIIPAILFAESNQDLSGIAENVVNVGDMMYQFFRAICMVAAAGLFLGAILKYQKHRKNPIIAKLSDVIMMLVLSGALLLLAFLPVNFK